MMHLDHLSSSPKGQMLNRSAIYLSVHYRGASITVRIPVLLHLSFLVFVLGLGHRPQAWHFSAHHFHSNMVGLFDTSPGKSWRCHLELGIRARFKSPTCMYYDDHQRACTAFNVLPHLLKNLRIRLNFLSFLPPFLALILQKRQTGASIAFQSFRH